VTSYEHVLPSFEIISSF